MYHIRLVKGLSYCGIISATKKKPDVFVEDKATADAAVATGYFELLDSEPETRDIIGHLDETQLNGMKVSDLKKLAEDMGLDVVDFKKKEDFVKAIAAESFMVDRDTTLDYEELERFTEQELTAYAKEHGVDVSDCKTKADILQEISAVNGGSYTMMELQEEG